MKRVWWQGFHINQKNFSFAPKYLWETKKKMWQAKKNVVTSKKKKKKVFLFSKKSLIRFENIHPVFQTINLSLSIISTMGLWQAKKKNYKIILDKPKKKVFTKTKKKKFSLQKFGYWFKKFLTNKKDFHSQLIISSIS